MAKLSKAYQSLLFVLVKSQYGEGVSARLGDKLVETAEFGLGL